MDLDLPQSGYEIIHKWFTRLVVAGIIYTQLKELNLKYPTLSKEQHQELLNAKTILESQK
ncbi:hypothetical protein NG799_25355 [Laspinema sp. D1]|uniref:Uncharacterized protein n=1 Tax=Laspinema palackyanum D2a TaxID=2953684 RepID=A0ABT2N071_9CYAN|nr:hypothetical protein [Laspinema sp. D2a]